MIKKKLKKALLGTISLLLVVNVFLCSDQPIEAKVPEAKEAYTIQLVNAPEEVFSIELLNDSNYSIGVFELKEGMVHFDNEDKLASNQNYIVRMLDKNGIEIGDEFNFTATDKLNYVYDVNAKQGEEKEALDVTLSFDNNAETMICDDKKTFSVKSSISDLTVKYTTSDESVATVDETNGEVTALKAGTTRITATFEGDEYYSPATASYMLTVNKKESNSLENFPNIKVEGIDEIVNGKNYELIKITGKNGEKIDYRINGSNWGTDIPSENKNGKYIIEVRVQNDKYINTTSVTSYLRDVQNVEFEQNEITTDGEEERILNSLTGALGAVRYESSDTQVATVDQATGEVKVAKLGTTTITAYIDEYYDEVNDIYYAKTSISYILKVEEAPMEVGKVSVEAKYINGNNYYDQNKIIIKAAEGYEISSARFGFFNTTWSDTLEFTQTKKDVCIKLRKKGIPGSSQGFHSLSKYLGENGSINFIIDNSAPTLGKIDISITEKNKILNFLTFGAFGNGQIKITVPADDNNGSGYAHAELLSLVDKENLIYEVVDSSDVKDGEATFTLDPDFKKVLYIKLEDNLGNATQPVLITNENSNKEDNSGLLNIETTPPTLDIEKIKGDYESLEGDVWFDNSKGNKLPTIKFNVSDDNSGIYGVIVEVNQYNVSNDEYLFNEAKIGNHIFSKEYMINMNEYSDKVKDGKFDVVIKVVDNAGNVTTDSVTFYQDVNNPSIDEFSFTGTSSSSNTSPTTSLKDGTGETYGYFFNEKTHVTVKASDIAPSSGVKSITYRLVDITDSTYSKQETLDVDENGCISFEVQKGFKGQIYAYAMDNVGLISEEKHPDGSAIENGSKPDSIHENHSKANIEYITNAVGKDVKGQKLFAGNVTLKLTISDKFTGLHDVTYTINGVETTSTIGLQDATVDGWEITQTDSNLITEITKEIKLSANDYNMNDIVVTLTGTDNADNTILVSKEVFSIDITKPVISVEYDNNDADSTFTDFYKADRVATITIKERNFNSNNFVAYVSTDGKKVKTDLNWNISNNENEIYTDETIHTATIVYNKDADYIFTIDKCVDLAGNSADPFASQSFTIDKTKPVITVVYNNNDARNGNYYNASRTASITITEHNFETTRINIVGTASDNGTPINFPTVNGWSNQGDVHTATIAYNYDGLFTFDIEYTDKAGNKADDYQQDEFYVDLTMPILEINGVENNSANAGELSPIVSYSDTNFDANGVDISLTGSNRGNITLDGTRSVQSNGETFTFTNMEVKKENDDVYTINASVVDKAGNETTKSLTYSLNRFGSVYTLVDDIKQYNGKYRNKEYNVKINETNVNSLQNMSVKLVKNNKTIELLPEKDYVISRSNVNGSWNQYQYLLNKKLFEKDGRYSVLLYSEDDAGNINENIDETKEASVNFGIDKTKPKIVSINVENDTTYAESGMTAKVSVTDNLLLDDVKVSLNGENTKLLNKEDIYSFDINEMNSSQNAIVKAKDAAGNETVLNISDFYVTTNVFVRWYNNKPLFIGSIAALVVLLGGGYWWLIVAKKKNENNKESE